MSRQFVAVRFRPGDRRTYTYHHDGPPVAIGEMVKIPGKRPTDGWTALKVEAISYAEPPFETKAILGVVVPERKGLFDGLAAGDDADLDRPRGA